MTDSSVGVVDPCDPGPRLYIQVMGTLLFLLPWPLVVLDIKYFPLGRPAAALAGAAMMIIFNVLSQDEVYEIEGHQSSLQTIFLLVGMMLLSYYFDREGLLKLIGLMIFGSRGIPMRSVLWKVCLLTGIMAAFVRSDITSLVLSPLLLIEFKRQGRPFKEILPLALGISTSANIGSASTVFGNPHNAFISSAANIPLLDFFKTELPAAILGLVTNTGMLYLLFYKVLFTELTEDDEKKERELRRSISMTGMDLQGVAGTIEEERHSLVLGQDQSSERHLSSQIAVERNLMFDQTLQVAPSGSYHSHLSQSHSIHSIRSRTPHRSVHSPAPPAIVQEVTVPEIRITHSETGEAGEEVVEVVQEKEIVVMESFPETQIVPLRERGRRELLFIAWLVLISVMTVVLLALPSPPVRFNLGVVPLGAGILTMLVDTILTGRSAFAAMAHIDWSIVLMFMGLLVWVGGFQNTCIPHTIFEKLAPHMNLHTFGGVLLFTAFVIVGANIFGSVPLTILMIDKLPQFCGAKTCEGPLGGLLLAWVTTVSANSLLMSSTTNLIVAEKAHSTAGYHLTFLRYARFGLISAFLVIFSGLPIVYYLGRYATTD